MKKDYTDIIMVLDRSGSMQTVADDTIGGFNKFLEEQKKVPGEARITLVQFDDQYESVLNAVPIKESKPLTKETYVPRGMTALLGAVGRAVSDAGLRFQSMDESARPEKVVVVIITDGLENSTQHQEWSRMWNASKVKEAIERQTTTYKWQFVFIGANQDAIMNAADIGIAKAGAINYTANAIGTQSIYRSMSENVAQFRTGASASLSWKEEDRKDQESAK